MIFGARLGEEKEQAYQVGRSKDGQVTQRWLVLIGGGLYCAAGLGLGPDVNDSASFFENYNVLLLAFTGVLFGSTYLRFVQDRSELVPILFALAYSAHIAIGATTYPEGGEIRFALLMGLLCLYLTALSPTLLISLAGISAAIIVALLSAVFLFALKSIGFELVTAFGYLIPSVFLAVVIAVLMDRTAREAFSLKWELSRRATTDELSGVANRTHIQVLASNEYARARRYWEPYSCLVLEIDGLDAIRDTWGAHAAYTVCRVFAGYCVLVMRHCDSFGRLSERRFMALLPETPGTGAFTLAKRMVDDLGRLEVNVYGEVIHFTISVGVSELTPVDQSSADIMRRAERGLKDAIEEGRDCAIFSSPPPSHSAKLNK